MVGVHYRLLDEGEPTDQLQEASHSQALVLLGNFNYPDTVSCRQLQRLLECLKDLMVISAGELTSDVKIGGSLGCSDHTLVEFTVLRDVS